MPKPTPLPDRTNVLLIGGGGREHALAWKLRRSPRLNDLWITADTTNAGLAALARRAPEALDLSNLFRLARWCDRNEIHLVVVGPEAPLARGIADALESPARKVFGPSKDAARIEADKAFAKDLMRTAAIPTAEARVFREPDAADEYLNTRESPVVIKAAGLAAGKGVFLPRTLDEALDVVDQLMRRASLGDAGRTVLVEEKLLGREVSVMALTDGQGIWMLEPAQDHKRVGEGDAGPNTGGMGAFSPVPFLDPATLARVERDIIVPTIDALKREGVDYRGVLYAGLMLTPAGPKVLEFNCRFGDPETQPLMMRFQGDLLHALWAAAAGGLDRVEFTFDPRAACCVVVCSEGYPGQYSVGHAVGGIDEAEALAVESNGEEIKVFHAGTARSPEGEIVTAGGRVLAVTALAPDLQRARDLANDAAALIHFDGAFFRRDIAHAVLQPT